MAGWKAEASPPISAPRVSAIHAAIHATARTVDLPQRYTSTNKRKGNRFMTDATVRAKLLGLPGSLRSNSNSLAVLRGLQDALPAD
uniref:hypothetical protein n=1 Tax=Methylobacterium sp. B34 TaxID=95563 RepID=UPI0019554874